MASSYFLGTAPLVAGSNAETQILGLLDQGCNEARWRQGQKASLPLPRSKLWSFGSKCTVLKKVLVRLLGLLGAPCSHSAPPAVIRRPHSDSAPGKLCPPFPPRYAPVIDSCKRYRLANTWNNSTYRNLSIVKDAKKEKKSFYIILALCSRSVASGLRAAISVYSAPQAKRLLSQ